ncbi:hypothetical protein [Roseovarius aquimarinus]|uniref:Uncharacterized protein n=1 Tax=Roseovarius aquimarinus TaxID=1229156 RepID=A0ABW7I7Q1_9RHOB
MRIPKPIRPSRLHRKFWDELRAREEEALIDKCDVVIGGWKFSAARHQVTKLVPRLSQLTVSCGEGSTTRLFENRTADDGRYSHTLTVRGTGSGEGVKHPYPTFRGYLKLRETSREEGNSFAKRDWEGILFSYLNINRSLQAQELVKIGLGADKRWAISNPYALALSDRAKSKVKERTLAPADNILDRTAKRTAYVLSRPAEQHFSDQIWAIFRTISKALPINDKGADPRREPTITLKTVEVCWDYFDEQPILTVLAIKSRIQSISRRILSRHLPADRLEEGLEYDSPSVMIYLKDGVAVRFYAKAETTVRFEVVYSRSEIMKAADVKGIQSITGAVDSIGKLKLDAANRLNKLFDFVRERSEAKNDDATMEELVEAVLGAADTAWDGVSLLTSLAYHHRISPFPHDSIYPQLRALKRIGVLQNEPNSPRGRNYVVTPRYRKARSQLVTSSLITNLASICSDRKRKIRRKPVRNF